MSFHTGQSFTFGETPSATKWNYLWENDYALADGTGIEDDAILSRHINENAVLASEHITASGTKLVQSAGQTITTSTITALSFDTERYDSGGYHAAGNPTRITIPTGMGGEYLFVGKVNWATNATGLRFIWMIKNGDTTERRGVISAGAAAGDTHGIGTVLPITLAAGDYMECYVFQSSGGNLAAQGESTNEDLTYFAAYRMGA